MHWLYDDPGSLSPGIFRWNQQIDMPEHPAAWLIKHEIAQRLIVSNPARLLPQCIPWRRCNSANDYITYITFSVVADGMNDFVAFHCFECCCARILVTTPSTIIAAPIHVTTEYCSDKNTVPEKSATAAAT